MIGMTTKKWTHQNVNSKGFLKTGGAIITTPGIHTSPTHSCTIPICKCINGFWVSINFGYDEKNKSVSGITFYFDSAFEFNNFCSTFTTHLI